jgi:HSP20 family protein
MIPTLVPSFQTLFNLQEAFERAMNNKEFLSLTSARGVFPPINILEKGDTLRVICELPGLTKDDLSLELKGKTLRIKGELKNRLNETCSVHRLERQSGSFDRVITLPYLMDEQKIEANLSNGVLTISLEKAEAEKPKAITINTLES